MSTLNIFLEITNPFGFKTFCPYVDTTGMANSFQVTHLPPGFAAGVELVGSDGKLYSDNELLVLRYLFLAQTFAMIYCKNLNLETSSSGDFGLQYNQIFIGQSGSVLA